MAVVFSVTFHGTITSMRASHLDLFEQPEIRFFNNRLGHWLEGRYESALCSILRVSTEFGIRNLKHSQSFAKEISPTGEGVNHIVNRHKARGNRQQ